VGKLAEAERLILKGWQTVESCPLCGAKVIEYRTVATAPYIIIDFLGGDFPVSAVVKFVRCTSCGLVIQSPRVTDERLQKFYTSGLYRQTLGTSQDAIDYDERSRALDLAKWLTIRPATHLDIGCGRGFFLRETHNLGADIMGYEPEEGYTLEDVPVTHIIPMEKFELVSMIHVLEHSTVPFADIKEAADLSSKWLLVEVPGDACMGGPLRFAHLWQFPLSVLMKMLPEGWKIVSVQSSPNVRLLAEKG
jgi:hypothetical protein